MVWMMTLTCYWGSVLPQLAPVAPAARFTRL